MCWDSSVGPRVTQQTWPAKWNLALSQQLSQPASTKPHAAAQTPVSRIGPNGWHDFLIGSPCAYHLYAGTEFTAYDVESQTGGRTTLSFSDTTAPGVATVQFNDSGGVDDVGYAPRVWLGAQLTDKWGVRGRYWRLSDSDSHSPELAPAQRPPERTSPRFLRPITWKHGPRTLKPCVMRSGEAGRWMGSSADGMRVSRPTRTCWRLACLRPATS